MTLPDWVLNEPVDVTPVYRRDGCVTEIYLITATKRSSMLSANPAVVLTFDDGTVLVNGVYVDLGEDLMPVCSLLDDCGRRAAPDALLPLGVTMRSVPDPDSARD